MFLSKTSISIYLREYEILCWRGVKKEDIGMSHAILLQPVPEIIIDSGRVGASLATLWKKWLADFEMLTTAAGITDNSRKCALLLYEAGSRVIEILGQLENTNANNAYDTAKAKLNDYFEPETSRRYVVGVYCFRQAH